MDDTPDYRQFLAVARGPARDFLAGAGEAWVARAPGRLDVMGGIADYSGSLVLEGTLQEAAYCAVRPRSDRLLRAWSYGAERMQMAPVASFPLDALSRGGEAVSYQDAQALFAADARARWAGYLLGAFHVLQKERGVSFSHGADLLLVSQVPLGAGVSSSAAIEVAAMEAVCAAFGISLEGLELARLCQRVENRVVGAPCGIMDQVTCALGEAGKLLALRCRPHTLEGTETLPAGTRVVGIDSRVKHSVGGSRYTRVRVAAFMGRKIIASLEGREPDGYLCAIAPAQFRERYYHRLPTQLRGAEFLSQYGETGDPVTRVDPDSVYRVRACTEHPVYENARVEAFRDRLRQAGTGDAGALEDAGALMYASHWSYGRRCGLGSPETDLLVRLIRERGAARGLYGAKITGGGSGGTVAVLCREDTDATIEEIAAEYAEQTGIAPAIFVGTSAGSRVFGVRRA